MAVRHTDRDLFCGSDAPCLEISATADGDRGSPFLCLRQSTTNNGKDRFHTCSGSTAPSKTQALRLERM